MFVTTKRLAIGAAAITPVVSIGAPAIAQAGTPTPATSQCVVNAVSAAQLQAGVQSVMVCFATRDDVKKAIAGGAGTGPVTSGIPGRYALATYYVSRTGDPMPGTLTITGDSCNDALYYTPDSWLPYMNAWQPSGCSTAKHYTGANFTGSSVLASGSFFKFDTTFARNMRSIKFGA